MINTCSCFSCIFCASVRTGLPYNILVFAAPAAKSAAAFSKLRVIFAGTPVSPSAGVSIVALPHAAASTGTGNGGGGTAEIVFVVLPQLGVDCTKVGENEVADARNTKGVAEARNSTFPALGGLNSLSSAMQAMFIIIMHCNYHTHKLLVLIFLSSAPQPICFITHITICNCTRSGIGAMKIQAVQCLTKRSPAARSLCHL